MKKIITFAFTALLTLTSNAQLKVQKEKLVKQNDKLYLRENGHDFEVDTKTVTVKLKEGKQLEAKGVKVLRENKLGYIDLYVPAGKDVEKYAQELDESGDFEIVELNSYGELCSITINDTFAQYLWHLDSTNVKKAWNFGMGNPAIKVAVIDNGVNVNHPDIGVGDDNYKNIDETLGWDYVKDSLYSLPTNDHGTCVAGIIGAKTNNHYLVAGVAGGNNQQGITLISFRVGIGRYLFSAFIDDAIIAATDNGAKIINMSFKCTNNTAINNAINYAYTHGVTLISASGNESASSISFPASHSNVFSVGAIDHNNYRLVDSNYGAGLDIVAPGEDILTTGVVSFYSFSQTSSAAPQVAGAAALMLSAKPNLSPSTIYSILRNTATKLPNYTFTNGWNNEVGYGLLNTYKAVISAVNFTINGPTLICDSTIYSVSPLPSGYTVVWTLSNQYYTDTEGLFRTNYPTSGKCMIKRDASVTLNGTLTAKIYDEDNELIKTLTKTVKTRQKASFDIEYSAIPPIIMPNHLTEDEPVKIPENFIIKLRDSRLSSSTMNVRPRGAYTYFLHQGDSVLFSANDVLYINCSSLVDCDRFSLCVYTNMPPTDPIIGDTLLPFPHPRIQNGFGKVSVTLNPTIISADGNEKERFPLSNDVSWSLFVYRYTDGKRVYQQAVQGNLCEVSTAGWESGLYIVRIVYEGKVFNYKVWK